MNYYEHHLGDYARDTAHLDALEHGIYRLLMDRYYITEQPIPDAQAHRFARCTPEQVAPILLEFFTRDGDVWRHKRIDAEIARFQEKQAKAKGSANARWKNAAKDANAMRTHTERNADAQPTQCEGNADGMLTKHQAPSTNLQTPSKDTHLRSSTTVGACPASQVCISMREAGLADSNPSDPRLLALLASGATVPEFVDGARDAVAKGKGWAYALGVVKGRRTDAANIRGSPGVTPIETAAAKRDRERAETIAELTGGRASPKAKNEREAIDGQAVRVG